MSFQSYSFLTFLMGTIVLCCLVGRTHRKAGQWLLTAASVLFCLLGTNGWQSAAVLCAGIIVTAGSTRYLAGETPYRKTVLTAACGYHILMLMLFKYTGFFTGGAVQVEWVPIGISFFTFQQLWLLKEVYTRQFVPEKGENLLLYGFFFPSLTSGPILRPTGFFPQLRGEKFLRPDGQDVAAGLYAFACGTAKKVLLADPLGTIANNGWSRIGELSAPGAWMVILAYTLQLYLDFSGYCDIASGCARMLGIRLPVNFDSPYRAISVTKFWKGWHMTLTTFLRECLYFPLGGSKRGAVRAYVNILIVFLVSGFWHGAGWTFILWGLLHGLAQVAERLLGDRLERIPAPIRWAVTFAFVNVAWVFFRAPSVAAAVELLKTAVVGGFAMPASWLVQGVLSKEVAAVQLLVPAAKAWMPRILSVVLFGGGLLVSLLPGNTIRKMEDFRPTVWRAAVLCLLLSWSILSFSGVATFIYSNF